MLEQNHSYEEAQDIQEEMGGAHTIGSSEFNLPTRLLHRFYEPLGLLSALGKARGENTDKTLPSFEQIDSLSAQDLRRQFLYELAFLCDHKKGGDTVTAIALGQTPQDYVFWVAANECPQELIVPFLEKLLIILKETHGERDGQPSTEEIFRLSVTFAHARIKTYAGSLLSDLHKLREFPACRDAATCELRTYVTLRNGLLTHANQPTLLRIGKIN
jgi:hypothetical protein